MNQVEIFAGSAHYKGKGSGAAVTIGNFDGVHLGHQELLGQIIKAAHERGLKSCVFTFEPSPRTLLSQKNLVPRIGRWSDKVRWLEQIGVDQIILEPFSMAFAQHSAEWFIREILVNRLKTKVLVVGHDFRFGRARSGDIDLIKRLVPNIELHQVEALKINKEVVSSSVIRALVQKGEVLKARVFLGRPHMLHGVVVGGEQRGRKIGFPTANVHTDTELLPAAGVYVVSVLINYEERRYGMANLGVQPTFEGTKFQVEVHIFDFEDNIYGADIEVSFLEHLRSERYFASADDLRQQLITDEQKARALLKSENTES